MLAYQHQIVSSDRLPNARRPEPIDAEERKRRSLEKVRRYLDTPTVEDVLVNEHTKAHRKWLMGRWNKYFRDNGIDPDTIWTGLCEGDREATSWSMAFFSDYVEYLKRMVMVLGSQEYEKRRMVNSASTPLAIWRKLIKEADFTVLSAKRLKDPRNKEKWRLRFRNHNARFPSSSISVFDVSKWLWTGLTIEVDPPLIEHITFTKVKATADDVLAILRTLYERAADLGIDAKTRISFHANVLLAAEGGFRPGTLGNYLRICIRKLAESRNVLGRTTFTSKLVEENC